MAGFRKKQPQQAALKVGLYGPAGSGKTFTALLLAEGLAKLDGKRVAMVDTEFGSDFYAQSIKERSVHPDAFDFDCLDSRSLTEVLSAFKSINAKEYGAFVIDSITHLWEAARLAYSGRQTKAGTIPFHAWGQIKKPYKELMNLMLSSPLHIFICGRMGNEFEEDDETEELKVVGKKMKAEGETAYEPHILLRMDPQKDKRGNCIYRAFAEKDRTGVLAGRTIISPCFDNICRPLLPLLGKTQAVIPSEDEVSAQDAGNLAQAEAEREESSQAMLDKFDARMTLAKTTDELDAISKELTPAVKAQMLTSHVTFLRTIYQNRRDKLAGTMRLESA